VLVKNPKLRELYDKTEIFIRKEFVKSQLNPSQGERYLMSFRDLSTFSMFLFFLIMYVEKH
jgi:hypothetical protein